MPGLRTKVGIMVHFSYWKIHLKICWWSRCVWKRVCEYLKEQGVELDNEISEEVIGFGEVLPKGNYILINDILNKEEEELSAKKGDKVIAFADDSDRYCFGCWRLRLFMSRLKKKYVSLEDIRDDN